MVGSSSKKGKYKKIMRVCGGSEGHVSGGIFGTKKRSLEEQNEEMDSCSSKRLNQDLVLQFDHVEPAVGGAKHPTDTNESLILELSRAWESWCNSSPVRAHQFRRSHVVILV